MLNKFQNYYKTNSNLLFYIKSNIIENKIKFNTLQKLIIKTIKNNNKTNIAFAYISFV